MTSVRRSLAITFLDRYAALAINIVSTIVLARLLTPAEIGVYSVAAVFVLLASILRDFGIADYLVQVKKVTPEALGAAFTLMVAVSWTLAGGIYLLAPWAAAYFSEPGVEAVLHILAINFLLTPFGAVFMALLKRAMRFEISLRIHLAQNITHAVTAIALAFLGFGYLSLAWAAVAGLVATVTASWWYRSRDLPLRPRFRGMRQVARFGGWASLGTIAGQGAESLPELAIGRAYGMAPVGYFSRANGLVQMFDYSIMNAAAPVVMPHFSRLRREGGDLAAHALHMTRLVTALAWPFYALLALFAAPVISLLFGDQWEAAVPLTQILCLFGALKVAAPYGSMVLKALNRPQDDGWINVCHLLALIGVLFVTLPRGLEAVVWGVALAMSVRSGLYLLRLRAILGFSWGDYLCAVSPSLGLAVAAWAPAALLYEWWAPTSDFWQWTAMGVAGGAGLLGWGVALRLLRHPLYGEAAQAMLRLKPGARG